MLVSFLAMLFLDGGVLTTPTAPQMTDVNPNRWGTDEPPVKGRGVSKNQNTKTDKH